MINILSPNSAKKHFIATAHYIETWCLHIVRCLYIVRLPSSRYQTFYQVVEWGLGHAVGYISVDIFHPDIKRFIMWSFRYETNGDQGTLWGYISVDISHPYIKVLSSGRIGTKAGHYISVDISHLDTKTFYQVVEWGLEGREGSRIRWGSNKRWVSSRSWRGGSRSRCWLLMKELEQEEVAEGERYHHNCSLVRDAMRSTVIV